MQQVYPGASHSIFLLRKEFILECSFEKFPTLKKMCALKYHNKIALTEKAIMDNNSTKDLKMSL